MESAKAQSSTPLTVVDGQVTAAAASKPLTSFDLPLNKIRVDKAWNCRQHFLPSRESSSDASITDEQKAIRSLADSIKEQGQIQPVLVRESEKKDGTYHLIIGFRRYAALKSLNAATIRCELFTGDERQALVLNLVENVQRQALTTYDLAVRCRQLRDEYKMSGAEIGRIIGKERSYVNVLIQRLEALPDYVLKAWADPADPRHGLCDTANLNKMAHMPDKEQIRQYWHDVLCAGKPAIPGDNASGAHAAVIAQGKTRSRPTVQKISEAVAALKEEPKGIPKAQIEGALAALAWAGGLGNAPKKFKMAGIIVYDPTKKPSADEETK